jgi:hypothetical protein
MWKQSSGVFAVGRKVAIIDQRLTMVELALNERWSPTLALLPSASAPNAVGPFGRSTAMPGSAR